MRFTRKELGAVVLILLLLAAVVWWAVNAIENEPAAVTPSSEPWNAECGVLSIGGEWSCWSARDAVSPVAVRLAP